MNTVVKESETLSPCVECPFILVRRWRKPLCNKPCFRHNVTWKAYQTCSDVRWVIGVRTVDGETMRCLGYNKEKNANILKVVT